MLIYWWNHLIHLLLRVYLPILGTILFALVAVSYWEEYAIASTALFLIISFIASDLIFRKKKKNR